MNSIWLGSCPFDTALARQIELGEALRKDPWEAPSLLGCEHPAVITLGLRASAEADLLEARGEPIPIRSIERGGQATLHSPGQLVIYPVLPLRRVGWGARRYLQNLTLATKKFLADWGVEASEHASFQGLHTARGKIVFVGVRIAQGVSSHGLAINVANDLSLFSRIRVCGLNQQNLDRLGDALPEKCFELEALFHHWTERFKELWASDFARDDGLPELEGLRSLK